MKEPREPRAGEIERMRAIVDVFNRVARDIHEADALLAEWLPARAAVEMVCGVSWDMLTHATRTAVGALLRDSFQNAYGFEVTPVRLLRKTSGRGSHMIAVYPMEWLAANRDAIASKIGEPTKSSPLLPFPGGPRP